ncbi:hypothetical protein CYMTET_16625 [Cymbomonas tetramitiformis]|uniref:U-box domain-containing protein n=1 Tax=Cymbomonas tetramitiformis TaxID=36881 RepID=A0AAE0GBU0_9CHLO|nr:hypothetical protein CYMTET_16625 [Cymbomonas tetramitiformis]
MIRQGKNSFALLAVDEGNPDVTRSDNESENSDSNQDCDMNIDSLMAMLMPTVVDDCESLTLDEPSTSQEDERDREISSRSDLSSSPASFNPQEKRSPLEAPADQSLGAGKKSESTQVARSVDVASSSTTPSALSPENFMQSLPVLRCPLLKDVMREPVIASDGHTYEKAAIKDWFLKHDTSPVTNLPFEHKGLIANHSFHALVARMEKYMSDENDMPFS